MELPLFYNHRPVAMIVADERGARLTYAESWLGAADHFPVSLTMPLGADSYEDERLIPWLMNLLPEGEPLRAMTRVLGASPEDVLGLIAETGNDLAGALSIQPAEPTGTPGYRDIPDEEALERIISELPARPFLVDEEGVAMSLAGAQDKLPVALRGNRIAIPIRGAASTHILKPDNPRLFGSVQNEALCMVLARRAGLATASITTGLAGTHSYLLVTRYDRIVDGEDARRIHQEDFCQALGHPPAAKYEFNRTGTRGPSLAEMFALLRAHMTAREITRLLDAVIFNIAIGNVDSHAKNYSLLLGSGRPALAPLYDLMSGLAWDGITQNHAQAIGSQRRGRHIYGRHWRAMAAACGLAGTATVRRVEQLTQRLLKELPAAAAEVSAMPAGAGSMLRVFEQEIGQRIAEVRAHATEIGESDDETGQNTEEEPTAAELSGDATAYHG